MKEVSGHIDSKHWKLINIKRDEVPKDVEVMPSVWSMRRKRNLTTNKVVEHKARLNLHGGKQVFGVNYFEIREAGVFRDTAAAISYLAIDGVRGLRTWKPAELGDWVYAKVEYRSQKAFPFGASVQYANQILLAHAYVPLLGQWLYIEGTTGAQRNGDRVTGE